MSFSRRGFLKGLTAAGVGAFSLDAWAACKHASRYAVLVDVDRCVGCRTCEVACRRWNRLSSAEEEPQDLGPDSYCVVASKGGGDQEKHAKWQCMHCVSPTCADVCPVAALKKTDDGPVLYDVDRCIGCRYCLIACPFNVPRFDWEDRKITKCVFCHDRLARGLPPACVEDCPQRLFSFGERKDIAAKAQLAKEQGRFVYGDDEVGGTSWLYVSSAPFEQLEFPEVEKVQFPAHSGVVLRSQVATVAVGIAALGFYSAAVKNRMASEGPDTGEEG